MNNISTQTSVGNLYFQFSSAPADLQTKVEQVSSPELTPRNSSQVEMKPHSYEYVSRYLNITPNETDKKIIRINLDKKLDNLSDKKAITHDMLEALEKGDWNHSIFNHPEYPFYALAALKDGHLSALEFCTVMEYWTLGKYHSRSEIETVPIFKDGMVNNEADSILKEIFLPTKIDGNMQDLVSQYQGQGDQSLLEFATDPKPFLTDEQFSQFYKELQKLKNSEQRLFVVSDLQRNQEEIIKYLEEYAKQLGSEELSNDERNQRMKEAMEKNGPSISHTIHSVGLFNFTRFSKDGKKMRVFLPASMVQILLKVKYGENAVTITPTLGVSSSKAQQKNGLNDTRDVALPFPGLELPKKADDVLTYQDYDFTYHDEIYHTILASAVPSEHRKAFIKISDALRELQDDKELAEIKPFVRMFRNRLIDMEHSSYRSTKLTDSERIWHAMQNAFAFAVLQTLSKNENFDPTNQFGMQMDMQREYDKISASPFASKMASRLMKDNELWCSRILDPKSLQTVLKTEKDRLLGALKKAIDPQLPFYTPSWQKEQIYNQYLVQACKAHLLFLLDKCIR